MVGTIENKFKGIIVDAHEGNSNITIKKGLLGPKAIIECGSCSTKYKKTILNRKNYFAIDETLNCKCGNKDYLSYRKKL